MKDMTMIDGDTLVLERTNGYYKFVIHDPDSPNGEYTIRINTNTITILTPLSAKTYLPVLNPFRLLIIWMNSLQARR